MIALDTNVLVRYAVKDHREQTAAATTVLANNRCFVLTTVILEVAWVLSSSSGYNLPRETVHERLLHILGLPNIEAEDAARVAQALDLYVKGMDFADALHLVGSAEVSALATFDRNFAASAKKLSARPPVRLIR